MQVSPKVCFLVRTIVRPTVTNLKGAVIAGLAVVLGLMTLNAQCVTCTSRIGAGFAGDARNCIDAGDCGASCLSCCLRYTCVGHPPACGENCGQACTTTFTCADIDNSNACDSDCEAAASLRRRPANNPTKLALAILPVLLQVSSLPRSITPFTLVREVWSFQHNPKGELHRRQTIAVRRDGSRSVTEPTLGGELKRTLSFADGRRITQFLGLAVQNTWHSLNQAALTERRTSLQARAAAKCVVSGWTKAGEDTIEEQPVTTLSHTSEDLAWKAISWSAPQLGCEDLRQLAYDVQADGSLALRTETKTVSLHIGEPDTVLFGERADFREVTPFEVTQLIVQKYSLPLSPEQIHEGLRLFEKAYSGSGRQRP